MPKLAITGGKPIRRKAFPPWPVYSNQEARALMRVLRSGNWGGYPFPNTHACAFAAKFAKAHGAKYGIALSNGTVAIEVSLPLASKPATKSLFRPTPGKGRSVPFCC